MNKGNLFGIEGITITLEFNPHAYAYEPLGKYVVGDTFWEDCVTWVSAEEKARCLEEDRVWLLQWYPRTLIRFKAVAGYTLDSVIAKAREIQNEP